MEVNGTKLSMMRGDSDSLTVSCYDGETERGFLEGDSVTLTVAPPLEVSAPIIQKRVTQFEDGKAVFIIDPADTADLTARIYIYDVQLDTKDGRVVTIVEPDEFELRGDVTQ